MSQLGVFSPVFLVHVGVCAVPVDPVPTESAAVIKPRGVLATGAGVDAKPVVARHFLSISPTNIPAPPVTAGRPKVHTPVPESVKFPSIRSAVSVRESDRHDNDHELERRVSPIELEGKGRSRSTAALPNHRRKVLTCSVCSTLHSTMWWR
jgi:hypothetical protein